MVVPIKHNRQMSDNWSPFREELTKISIFHLYMVLAVGLSHIGGEIYERIVDWVE